MLLDQIQQNLKNAQLKRNETEVSTLRLLLSEIKYAQIKIGGEISDPYVIGVVQREIKKRQESKDAFEKGDREDLANKEQAELMILSGYLPPQMSDEQLTKVVEDSINEVGASSLNDMGAVMAKVKEGVGQSADMGKVSGLVKERLSK